MVDYLHEGGDEEPAISPRRGLQLGEELSTKLLNYRSIFDQSQRRNTKFGSVRKILKLEGPGVKVSDFINLNDIFERAEPEFLKKVGIEDLADLNFS